MKITDCDISRRAQVALYKRGFSTVEKLRNSDVNYDLFESLKCEPMNLVNEIANLVSIVQSGKIPNAIKGKSIAYSVGLDYPKNLYDSMIKLLQKNNHPALKKLPFTDSDNSILKLNIDGDMKASLLNEGICTVNELMRINEEDLAMRKGLTDEYLNNISALKRKISKSKGV